MSYDIQKIIDTYTSSVIQAIQSINKQSLEKLINLLIRACYEKRTIFVFGNGGSGATASHFCNDLTKGLWHIAPHRIKTLCLNDNTPIVTAIANDISYDDIFIEQLKSFAHKDDIVIGFSGSGNSLNILKALEYANSIQAHSVILCGFDGGLASQIAQLVIHVPINSMGVSEDVHMILTHCISYTMKTIFEKNK
jgi:D-sedoheptulose 7-phosphate isomerase